MSPTPVEKIREPADLELPPEVGRVLESLTSPGRAQFIQEVTAAIVQGQRDNNLRPLQDVILAWYRTLLARQSTTFQRNVRWAREHPASDPDEATTPEQYREWLDV